MPLPAMESLSFTVNGTTVTIESPDYNMCLADFLRDSLGLRGTKIMCREGACGACIVLVSKEDPLEDPKGVMPINSCQALIGSLNSMHVMTIEHLGSPSKELSFIQKNLINKFGMQCGFCTSGVVMNALGALAKSREQMAKDPCSQFDGNICRCTGYRPIMDAMQCSAKECSEKDIEDLIKSRPKKCTKTRVVRQNGTQCHSQFHTPSSIKDLLIAIPDSDCGKVKLLAGNSGRSFLKKNQCTEDVIDLSRVRELKRIEVNTNKGWITFGAAVTLTEMSDVLSNLPTMAPIVTHLQKIGSIPLRNTATWAGNLMIVHENNSFPSDIFILMEIAEAFLTVCDFHGNEYTYHPLEFLDTDMTNKIILSANIKIFTAEDNLKTFKVMPRQQNCHAYVNAAFSVRFDPCSKTVTGRPLLIFGALGRKPFRALKTERYLASLIDEKISLKNRSILSECLRLLDEEIDPMESPAGPSKQYLKQVAINLFYKYYLWLLGNDTESKSEGVWEESNFSFYAEQSFKVDKSKFPLTKPMKRINSEYLVSGKTQYVNDIPTFENEAFAALVLAGRAPAKFIGVDASDAMECPGFIEIFTYKDVPGKNQSCMEHWGLGYERILCDADVSYAGEPVAVVIADTQKHANEIAAQVKVILEIAGKPIISLEDAVKNNSFLPNRCTPVIVGDPDAAMSHCDRVIEGQLSTKSMHHFYLEPQTCVVALRETEVEVYVSTQFASGVQEAVADVLGIQCNKVFVTNTECGGAFGGKTRGPPQFAAITAVASKNLDRPIRMVLDYATDMKSVGARAPFLVNYQAGFTDAGILKVMKLDCFVDSGCCSRNVDAFFISSSIDNGYYCPNWSINIKDCKTNRPPSTHVRGPGTSQSKFIIESIMDEVAHSVGLSPELVRQKNFYQCGQVLKPFQVEPLPAGILENTWNDIIKKSDFIPRHAAVECFNETNRWKKRGIALMPLLWRSSYHHLHYTVLISILYADASVVIHHGGTEMGQGMNTRVTQLAARCLGIPVDMISVGTTSTRTAPNSAETGGSVASEQVLLGVSRCCQILNSRLQPIKDQMPNATWHEVIGQCVKKRLDLSVTYMNYEEDKANYLYASYGAVCAEVEVDILTGETKVVRSDILFDCGQSINPGIDIGQVEGAYVMGIGQFMLEKIKYNPETGEEVTSGTWDYFPPMPKDIPSDFRLYLAENSVNKENPFGSKAVGEPAICMGVACLLATRRAVEDARRRNGDAKYVKLNAPATIEAVQQATVWKRENLIIL